MQEMTNNKFSDIMERFIEFRSDESNDECDESKFCSENNISLVALKNLKATEKGWKHEVLRRRREDMILSLSQVDKGLLMKARIGDTRAAELLYERLEGYIRPKAPVVGVNVQFNLAGMLKNAISNSRTIIEPGPPSPPEALPN